MGAAHLAPSLPPWGPWHTSPESQGSAKLKYKSYPVPVCLPLWASFADKEIYPGRSRALGWHNGVSLRAETRTLASLLLVHGSFPCFIPWSKFILSNWILVCRNRNRLPLGCLTKCFLLNILPQQRCRGMRCWVINVPPAWVSFSPVLYYIMSGGEK